MVAKVPIAPWYTLTAAASLTGSISLASRQLALGEQILMRFEVRLRVCVFLFQCLAEWFAGFILQELAIAR